MNATCSRARVLALPLAALATLALAGATAGQSFPRSPTELRESVTDPCPCCTLSCLKPWSIPDRWDDVGRPGYPEWAGNGAYDAERFDDYDRNLLYDPGEPFTDGNGDGVYTAEWYHPLLTGYVVSRDLGQQLLLKPGSPDAAPVPGVYYAVDFLPRGRHGPEGDLYERAIAECWYSPVGVGDWFELRSGNLAGPTAKGVADLIARDPGAHWDPVSQTIQGSAYAYSPRRAFLCLHDPRTPGAGGRSTVRIIKFVAIFIEGMGPTGDLTARFMRVQTPGGACPPGYESAEEAFIQVPCP